MLLVLYKYYRQLCPNFLFHLQSTVYDTTNFDLEFTEESVTNSVRYPIVNASVLDADDTFLGFSYAPPTDDSFL